MVTENLLTPGKKSGKWIWPWTSRSYELTSQIINLYLGRNLTMNHTCNIQAVKQNAPETVPGKR